MFKSPRAMFFVLGGLLVGITLFIAFLFVDPANRTNSFWYTISGIMLSEVMLSLSVMDLGGNHGDRAMPFRFCNGLVSILYFCFTLIMLVVYWYDADEKTIRVLQIVGLFVALTLYVLLGLAARSVSDQAAKFQAERVNKKRFKIEIEFLKTELLPFFSSNKNLEKQFMKLADLARFAPESLAGVEQLDQEIFDGIATLQNAAGTKNEIDIDKSISNLILLFQKRQILAKELR